MQSLKTVFEETLLAIEKTQEEESKGLSFKEVGKITSLSAEIVKAEGLSGVGFEELVEFPGNLLGFTFNVDEKDLGIALLGNGSHLRVGDEISRTGRVMDVPVGEELIGRVIDPLGNPLDGKEPFSGSLRLPIERPAPAIMDRAPVQVPLQTGIKVIDALVPIGRGQRELILGDRSTGKTSVAIDTILNQKDQNVLCIYCAIGQRSSSVAKTIRLLREHGAMENTIVVVTSGDDPPGLNFIAPYAATSIGEYFMEKGRDVLLVYDDLIQHAQEYRELSLLLKRTPGRSAFPGDIFYIHSRLLERATHLHPRLGGGSLTALPIIETQAQNIADYIATNLISITDGQIYMSPTLFGLGILPAVDVNKSVSRVGGKAQLPAYRSVAGSLKLEYAQFEELEEFVRFGAHLEEGPQRLIDHGRRIRACLKQEELNPVPVFEQLVLLLALSKKLFQKISLDKMKEAEKTVYDVCKRIPSDIQEAFHKTGALTDSGSEKIVEMLKRALESV